MKSKERVKESEGQKSKDKTKPFDWIFLVVGGLIDVNHRLSSVQMFWYAEDRFIFISYSFIIQFINKWNKALSKDFKQIFSLV